MPLHYFVKLHGEEEIVYLINTILDNAPLYCSLLQTAENPEQLS